MDKPLVLILCTGNSCRSHLAEGILRAAAADSLKVASAGSKPAGYVHPLAIQAMQEIGIDISQHRSKHLSEFLGEKWRPSSPFAAMPIRRAQCSPAR